MRVGVGEARMRVGESRHGRLDGDVGWSGGPCSVRGTVGRGVCLQWIGGGVCSGWLGREWALRSLTEGTVRVKVFRGYWCDRGGKGHFWEGAE